MVTSGRQQEWAQLCRAGLKKARESGTTDLLLALKEIRILLEAEPQQSHMVDPQVVEELLAIALEGVTEPNSGKTVAALIIMLDGLDDAQLTECFSSAYSTTLYTTGSPFGPAWLGDT
ncbi:hypothetical protein BESB_053410 [Besnoitia besnoiti]|uniref:Uncharacterized protein n=1 Tax=Besnoitia besnoiti TaxID=94643 RepID=A0A2A9MJW0_BESBE|nr:hypothetical protein BESB_053410 [Besnoitia besnoiti]PFH35690.1 hypothetical protein BESB_053410 [Besnoitia besnoiti]